jgi:hypothetical protein
MRQRNFTSANYANKRTMQGQYRSGCCKVLSISSDQQRLIAEYSQDPVLHIYALNGSLESKISLPGKLMDAMWTLEGHILCSVANDTGPLVGVENTNKNSTALVLLVSQSGDVIAQTPMTAPRALSTWYDDVVYLADLVSGVYRSTDGGRTWSHLFKMEDKWFCIQVIQVSDDLYSDTLFTLEHAVGQFPRSRFSVLAKVLFKRRLRKYTINRQSSRPTNFTSSTLILPDHVRLGDDPKFRPTLACDDSGNVFLVDAGAYGVLHLLSYAGQFKMTLFSGLKLFSNAIHNLALDSQYNKMYVGLCQGTVGILTLTYEDNQARNLSLAK